MKTTADQDDILFELINGSVLKTAINGGIYKGERPLNSNLEDIVISSTVISDGTLQLGVANVNIYVPKQNFNIGGKVQILKNSKRVAELLGIAKDILEEHHGDYFLMWLSNQFDYDEPEINQTRISFRIEFRFSKAI